jgi:hypothetical protein
VEEFIDQNTKWWNSHLIKQIFHAEEARIICQLPLNLVPIKDSLIWRDTLNVDFSVRSVYHMKKDLQAFLRSGGSRQGAVDKVLKTIWKFKIPNAVKMFMWKACSVLLPTKANLLRCGVVPNAFYPICM